MCGFAGWLSFKGQRLAPEARRQALAAMGRQLALRGPDDEQFHDDGLLCLIFRRLSIIDVAGGRQPLWNPARDTLAVVNGELYNHAALRAAFPAYPFATRSDAEVVLPLYERQGAEFAAALNGMFAALLWDTRQRRLLLARDRLGIKPLYWAEQDGVLYFASELKALLAHPLLRRTPDWQALDWYQQAHDAGIPSYVQGVRQLQGGRRLECTATGVREDVWWDIRDHFPAPGATARPPEHYIEGCRALLEDSVRGHLLSDVPVGLFLSGGFDSSLIAALAARHCPGLHCFTVAEENTWAAGDVGNAQRLATRLGLPQHSVRFAAGSLLHELDYRLEDFEHLIWLLERPAFDLEWLFKLELHRYARSRVPGLKVILLGQGADEFAGGYSCRHDTPHRSWAHYLRDEVLPEQHRRAVRAAGWPPHLAHAVRPPAPDAALLDGAYHRHMQFFALQLQFFNLWHEDRTAAGNSLEARVPFLDHRLVEWLAAIPPALHGEWFFNKQLLRAAGAPFLPDFPAAHPKVSFFFGRRMARIHALGRELALRLFDRFAERYLDSDSVFEPARLRGLHARAAEAGGAAEPAALQLLECMSIEIFARLVADPAPLAARAPPWTPSPLQPLDAATEAAWAAT